MPWVQALKPEQWVLQLFPPHCTRWAQLPGPSQEMCDSVAKELTPLPQDDRPSQVTSHLGLPQVMVSAQELLPVHWMVHALAWLQSMAPWQLPVPQVMTQACLGGQLMGPPQLAASAQAKVQVPVPGRPENSPPRDRHSCSSFVMAPPVVELPPDLGTPPVLGTPPTLGTPPVDWTPPVLGTPPVDWTPPVLGTPPVDWTPPVFAVPPVSAWPPVAVVASQVTSAPVAGMPPVAPAPPRILASSGRIDPTWLVIPPVFFTSEPPVFAVPPAWWEESPLEFT